MFCQLLVVFHKLANYFTLFIHFPSPQPYNNLLSECKIHASFFPPQGQDILDHFKIHSCITAETCYNFLYYENGK